MTKDDAVEALEKIKNCANVHSNDTWCNQNDNIYLTAKQGLRWNCRTGYCGWCVHRDNPVGTLECDGCYFTDTKPHWKLLICQVPPCCAPANDSGACDEHEEQLDEQ